MLRAVAIIPARYHSSRFPGKALAEIRGKPMIQHVYERTASVESLEKVIIATDDERIREVVRSFKGSVVMTSTHHSSGTERIAEVARELSSHIVVNVQGDEPLIHPSMILEVLSPFHGRDRPHMSTLKKRMADQEEIEDPNMVKVVTDTKGMALYFSRSPIPYPQKKKGPYFKHIGLYAYERDFLIELSQLKKTSLEEAESLEQLRVLEHGYQIKVIESQYNSIGVDTPKDLERVKEMIESR